MQEREQGAAEGAREEARRDWGLGAGREGLVSGRKRQGGAKERAGGVRRAAGERARRGWGRAEMEELGQGQRGRIAQGGVHRGWMGGREPIS